MKVYETRDTSNFGTDVRWFPTEEEARAYCRGVCDMVGDPELTVEGIELPATAEGICQLVNSLLDAVLRQPQRLQARAGRTAYGT